MSLQVSLKLKLSKQIKKIKVKYNKKSGLFLTFLFVKNGKTNFVSVYHTNFRKLSKLIIEVKNIKVYIHIIN